MRLLACCIVALAFAAGAGVEIVRHDWWFVALCACAATLFLALALDEARSRAYREFEDITYRAFVGGHHG